MNGELLDRSYLRIGVLGIVFGDIGTSPLYAFRTAVEAAGKSADGAIVLGILSVLLWTITLVVSVKYVLLILRIDNHGEGGILALAARLDLHRRKAGIRHAMLLGVALAGAALLFGDGIITPAISVLAAVVGLEVCTPDLKDYVLPVASAIVAALFLAQRAGTGAISRIFGPIMMLWFATLGVSGLWAIANNPTVLGAISPHHAVELFLHSPALATAVSGAAFLAVTGGEALYADLGQFGRHVISRAWFAVVMPALLLNYFGQGAILLGNGAMVSHTFFSLFPSAALLPITLLATVATIIASQAIITGLFSLARQAIELGLLPPMRVVYQDEQNEHSVYIPVLNSTVGIMSFVVAVGFGSSTALASAYGIAVAGAMITTTILFLAVIRGGPLWTHRPLFARFAYLFIAIDLFFVAANLQKIADGGYVPLLLACFAALVMVSWRSGRNMLAKLPQPREREISELVRALERSEPDNAAVAAFLIRPGRSTSAPLQELTQLLPVRFAKIVIVSVWTASRPYVAADSRISVIRFNARSVRVDVRVGYMQRINLPALLGPVFADLGIDSDQVIYIAGLERPISPPHLNSWDDLLKRVYVLCAKLAARSTDRFSLPKTRTLEIGVPRQL